MRRLLPLLGLLAALPACSSLHGLDREPMDLGPGEQAAVMRKVEEARTQSQWTAAWNQAVEAGAGRAVLEDLAVGALDDAFDPAGRATTGTAGDMHEALRERWGGLGPEARARVDALRERQIQRGRWDLALEVELLTAEDAPSFRGAWQVYERAPADVAPDLLEGLREAREAHAGSDG